MKEQTKQTKQMLIGSFVILVLLCIGVMFVQAFFMSRKSKETISEIGDLYMAETNRQIQQKFEAVTDIWRQGGEGIIKRNSPEEAVYGEEMKEELAFGAYLRNFTSMELYTDTGKYEVIYGNHVIGKNEIEVQKLFDEYESWISGGVDEEGNDRILLALEAAYPMADGETSSIMVLGFPVEDLENVLVLDDEDSLAYSMIIRKDGSFIVKNRDVTENNYYTRLKEKLEQMDGKEPETYIEEFKAAIDSNEEYKAQIEIDGESRYLYCIPLRGTEWYLVTIMPYNVLENAVSDLGDERQKSMFGMIVLILVLMMVVFSMYYRMSQSQMKQLEVSLKATENANKAKSEFLSNMSHDIRTPMNGIVGMTTIALANIHDEGKVQNCLKKITISSRHLLGLINDVLDMSKIESGKISLSIGMISLREIMESIVNIVQPQVKSKKQHFDIFIRDIETEMICCDDIRLNQVLLNLLSNAIKYTGEGGTINIILSQEPSPKGPEYVRCHFKIKDTGIGMSEEFQKQIFETFSREDRARKIEGTGLGMPITRYIVEMMGGTIEVDSHQGVGTEVHVTLDFERAEEQVGEMLLPSWHVLVVDNNQDLCEGTAVELEQIGIHADWTTSGENALQVLEEHLDQPDAYQMVLLDWKMPRMDGGETIRMIHKLLGEDFPVLIISAYDWSDIESEARKAGAVGFISKPLFKSNLYMALRRFTGEISEIEKQQEVEEIHFENKHILLAEDNELNMEIAKEFLSSAGFVIDWAENGKICTEMFADSPEGYYDVVLMDIRMPVMDGYEACRIIRGMERSDNDLPIIAMTADAFSEDIQKSLESGMDEHVAKPIDFDKLFQVLGRYLK